MSNDSFITRALDFLLNRKKGGESSTQQHHSVAGESVSSVCPEDEKTVSADNCTSTTSQSSFLKPEKEKESPFSPANVMKALSVEILEDGGDGYYLVGFQGGVFVLFFEEDRLNVMYNDVLECSYDDTVKASLVANEINSAYAVWSCYLRTSARGTSGLPVKVCFSQMFSLTGQLKETTDFIHGVMSSAFSVGREYRERFKKAQQDHSNLANTLNQKDFVYKLELAKRLMEVHNYDEIKEEMPPTSYLRVETLADLFSDTEFGQPQVMKLLVDDELKFVNDPVEIASFDIRAFVRNLPQPDTLQHLTAMIVFEKQDLIVSLKQMPGSSQKSLFFALNVMRSGVEDDVITHNRSMISFRDTIEIRLTSEQEDYWEVKYMIDEAKDKHNTDSVSSLSDEQKMMLIQLSPNVQDDMYWGLKFFNQDCLFQALFYFKRIYYNYCIPGSRGKQYEDTLADVCLYLGIAYCQLQRYELAFYYLDKTKKYDSILASEWYTNCLCSLKDPGAFRYIKRMIDTVSNNLEDNELDDDLREDLYNYYLFLERRLVQTLISQWQFTEAENLISQMIERKENVEFCKKEQQQIRKIRMAEAEKRMRRSEQKTQTEKQNPSQEHLNSVQHLFGDQDLSENQDSSEGKAMTMNQESNQDGAQEGTQKGVQEASQEANQEGNQNGNQNDCSAQDSEDTNKNNDASHE